MLLAAAPQAVIWGGNYFADLLPATGKWLVWDKGQRINQSDGELAWTSRGGALRIKTLNRVELMTDGAEHPTQKPVRLIKWCIEQLEDEPAILLDPTRTRLLLRNLIDNALRYSPDGARVLLSVRQEAQQVVLQVQEVLIHVY